MPDKKNFLGLPIKGNIVSSGHQQVPQKPATDLAPLIESVLSVPEVTALRWRQYTPYFNDGEPCVFSAGEPEIKATFTGPNDGDYEDGFVGTWGLPHLEVPSSALVLSDSLSALEAGLTSGAFDNALIDLFGDHAEVIIQPGQAIEVEFYEHD